MSSKSRNSKKVTSIPPKSFIPDFQATAAKFQILSHSWYLHLRNVPRGYLPKKKNFLPSLIRTSCISAPFLTWIHFSHKVPKFVLITINAEVLSSVLVYYNQKSTVREAEELDSLFLFWVSFCFGRMVGKCRYPIASGHRREFSVSIPK